jgi:hypothetical protein
VLGAVLREVELRLLEDATRLVSRSTISLPWPSLLGSLKSGKSLRARRALASISGWMIWVLILSPMSLLALELDHVAKLAPLRDDHRRREVVRVGVLVADVLDEQHEQDVVLVLAGIHAAAQFIAGGPEGGVEVGFLECHGLRDPCLCPCVVRSWTVGGFGTRRHGRGEFSPLNDPPMAYKVRGMEFIEIPVFTRSLRLLADLLTDDQYTGYRMSWWRNRNGATSSRVAAESVSCAVRSPDVARAAASG